MEVGLDFSIGVETVSRMKRLFIGEIARNYAADCIVTADM